ncbi:19983_t:CDS:2 [Gigaspora margarita]|uniref:19983_t:CDS:1 n=1 Tax=Gigaspora margarita TaxID=4874 RepID=A0ABN7UMK2_GIGMA|nr:19983_t:CDS:2 [Gigaspora margarita]
MANCFCKFIVNTFFRKKKNHKQSFTEKILDDSQEIFNDYNYQDIKDTAKLVFKAIDDVLNGEKKELRHDSVISFTQSEINVLNEKMKILPTLPEESMKIIFNHVNEESRKDLISCLLVDKYWCNNALPLLWNQPFDIVSRDNRHKLIRTYISSKALFKYEKYLEEFSYNNLYLSADAGIKKYLSQDFMGHCIHTQTLLIVGSLCQLIMRDSTKMTCLMISKFIGKMDLPDKATFMNSHRSLSNLSKFQFEIQQKMTKNTMSLLQTISNLCTKIQYLDIKLSYPDKNNEIEIMENFSKIIISQKNLKKVLVSGARSAYGIEIILKALELQSENSESLNSLEFTWMDLTDVNLFPLTKCKSLKHLTVQYCQGLTKESTISLLQAQFSLESLKFGCSPVAYSTQLVLLPIFGKMVKKLTVDLLNQDIIIAILDNCQEIRHLKLENCFIQKPIEIGKLLHGLIKLEKLEIFINVKNGDYENMILNSKDLPSSLECLILECGFTTIQLEDLLKNCKLNSLYINYSNFKTSHFRVVSEYAKRTKEMKILGIESDRKWMIDENIESDRSEKEAWEELEKLRNEFGIICYIKYIK